VSAHFPSLIKALNLQGIDFAIQCPQGKNGHPFSNSQLLDLAGNAFNGYVVMSLALALFTCVEWASWLDAQHQVVFDPTGSEDESDSPLFSENE
jgi:hypothetical protein